MRACSMNLPGKLIYLSINHPPTVMAVANESSATSIDASHRPSVAPVVLWNAKETRSYLHSRDEEW